MPIGLPRGVDAERAAGSAAASTATGADGAQQAESPATTSSASWNTGMFSSVWKCSHAMPCGSVIQCFSLRA
jgi:hypothetical protein